MIGCIENLPEHVRDKIVVAGGHWLWAGRVTEQGYGQLRDGLKVRAAHRVVYELLIGPIPSRHELHHRPECPRRCVDPTHMTPVSRSAHKLLHRPTHCQHGHELTPENSYVPADGNRRCRTCIRDRKARLKRARRERQR